MTATLALCIPAYNAALYLPRLLESARNQSVKFDEIWVHDDCSTDNTAQVAESFGARVLRSPVNRGCSLGKDYLLRQTSCEFVHFHDADDELKPGFVAQARTWMAQDDCPDVVLFAYEYRDHESNQLLARHSFDDESLREDPVAYCIANPICPFSGLYRVNSVIEAGGYRIPDAQLYNEDKAFHCRLARAGLRFAADPAELVVNYLLADSMSNAAQAKCAMAQYAVMVEAASGCETRHLPLIAHRLWRISAVAAALDCWSTADDAAALAAQIHPAAPQDGNAMYRWLAPRLPRLATRLREWTLRISGRRSTA